ncbi:MotA/TolQ/ExbB proton channel family protein [Marivirga harenae]|uniref:MotA/TolQ/ExbB proton channel family protein n=1 Tax=Marivirga harenae TaxID=2010992 RepID=UPI0026E04EA8|nr:MotA/TolQ/ExbB proton channel family protein [Marivirga harenae]WKV13239.1 MotA/TolQ/ExbB proton channel family protein [Marivirga harenae]|tara:strand:- start:41701 stop:42060 length:360 start_codon:yes stop_codon:yes gene_type:complete
MKIIEIHVEGGILFMGILFCLLVAVVVTSALVLKHRSDNVLSEKWLKISQDIALFALVFGILGQLVGLVGAFQAIEQVGEVSQALLAGGLKVSSYTTLYGFFIFLLAKLFKIGFLFSQK